MCSSTKHRTSSFLLTTGNSQDWHWMDGKMIQVDVSPDDSVVWGVNSAQQIFFRKGDGDVVWQRVNPGSLKHVSVGSLGVWGVDKADIIWYRSGVSTDNPAGTGWQNIEGKNIYLRNQYFDPQKST